MNNQKKVTLWVVGDSTVSSFQENIYMPRYGWGTALYLYLNENITVRNLAISGTSSKSFRSQENYKTLVQGISSGDFLMIGFGHNDEKTGDVTYTSGTGDYQTEGSFANSLYRYYIQVARQAGASSILVTPIPRRDPEMKYKDDFVHVTAGGDYAEAIRKLGRDVSVPVCDLTRELVDISIQVDKDGDPDNDTLYQHARTSSNPICVDDTHTSLFGAVLNAYLIAQDVRKSTSPLKEYLKETLENPLLNASEWKKKSVNPDYVDPVYVRPDSPGDFWPAYQDDNGNVWYGTVFGDINHGNTRNREDFFLGRTDSGSMRICTGITGNNGKIASKSDGIAMYFTRIPVKKSFKLTANVTLDSFNTAGEAAGFSAFGLMVRDDMYMDEAYGAIMGDYVAAGITFRPGYEKGSNTFARKHSLNVFEGGELPREPRVGETIPMMVASTRDGYMAQVGDNAPVIAGYDFALTAVDPQYVYVGFFTARTVSMTVTDIRLEIDGEEMKAYDSFHR